MTESLSPKSPAPRTVVLAGGLSHERDVSVRSGRRVSEALRSAGVEVHLLDVDSDLLSHLDQISPDVVWPLLHGAGGEDGSLRGVLDLYGARTVGSTATTARMVWDKPVAKHLISQAGVVTPEYLTLPQSLFRELGAHRLMAKIAERIPFPLIVKPAQGGSALGVSLVSELEQLPRALVECFAFSDTALIERAITGTEVVVSLVDCGDGLSTLPAIEIVTEGCYDFDARYNPGRTEYFAPARLSAEVSERVGEVARICFTTLGLTHLGRIDLFVEQDTEEIFFLEANTAPGMTETSLLPQAVEAAGFELSDLYRRLVTSVAAGN